PSNISGGVARSGRTVLCYEAQHSDLPRSHRPRVSESVSTANTRPTNVHCSESGTYLLRLSHDLQARFSKYGQCFDFRCKRASHGAHHPVVVRTPIREKTSRCWLTWHPMGPKPLRNLNHAPGRAARRLTKSYDIQRLWNRPR